MQPNACTQNGLLPTAAALAAALTDDDYQSLTAFAAYRRDRLLGAMGHPRLLEMTEPADLVHHALFQVLIGEAGFPAGRKLPPENRASKEAFIQGLGGIINSQISALAKRSENRLEHLPIGDPLLDPGSADPMTGEDPNRVLEMRDLKEIVFAELRRSAPPEVASLLAAWEESFLADDRLGSSQVSRHHYRTARARLRTVVRKISAETPKSGGKKKVGL